MPDRPTPSVQTHGRRINGPRLSRFRFFLGVNRVTNNRKSKMVQVQSDLVGSSRHRPTLDQGSSVFKFLKH